MGERVQLKSEERTDRCKKIRLRGGVVAFRGEEKDLPETNLRLT